MSREWEKFPKSLTLAWLGAESNRRHEDFQSSALPTELPSRRVHPAARGSLCKLPEIRQAPAVFAAVRARLLLIGGDQYLASLIDMSVARSEDIGPRYSRSLSHLRSGTERRRKTLFQRDALQKAPFQIQRALE